MKWLGYVAAAIGGGVIGFAGGWVARDLQDAAPTQPQTANKTTVG